jgi:hypothetical protein
MKQSDAAFWTRVQRTNGGRAGHMIALNSIACAANHPYCFAYLDRSNQ